jgi:hypothetical protein
MTAPSAISRYLRAQGFTRSIGIHPGFGVYLGPDDRIIVVYRLGVPGADMNPEQRREVAVTETRRMERVLSGRYTVIMFEPDTGWHGFRLEVADRPEAGLTAGMRAALDRIRRGDVVYRYKPLTPALSRPVPVSAGELTPGFSGGLRAVSVMALERRGLVRLVPVTPEHGRVTAVDG